MMPNFKFDQTISLGNLISVATVIVGLSLGWQTLASETGNNVKTIVAVETRVSALELGLNALIREINNKEIAQTRLLTELQTDMRYTREAVDEIRENSR